MIKPDYKRNASGSNGTDGSSDHKQEAKLPKLFLVQVWLYMICVRCVCCCRPRKNKEEASAHVPLQEAKVLLVGLNGAGKSSMLARLKCVPDCKEIFTEALEPAAPTQGFAIQQVTHSPYTLNFWEVGGAPNLRPFWQRYTRGIRSIVFVVDATDPLRFNEAVTALLDLLRTLPSFKQLPLLVLINKSESVDAVSKAEVEDAFDLGSMRPYNVSFRNVSMLPKGAGNEDENLFYSHQLMLAMNWLCSGL